MNKDGLKYLLILLVACNQIENSNTLDKNDIEHIKSMNLLDEDETIIEFYSQFRKKLAGNFFTNKRIASYWLDKRNPEKNSITFAYYRDITKIDTIHIAALTYTSYLLITKRDSTQFKVQVGGDKQAVKHFFEKALEEWKKDRLSDLIHAVLNLSGVIKLSKSELVQRKYGKVFLFFEDNALKPEDSIIYQNGVALEVNNAREPSDKPHYVFKKIDIHENTAYVLVELDVTGFVCFGNLNYVDGKWIPDHEFRVGYR